MLIISVSCGDNSILKQRSSCFNFEDFKKNTKPNKNRALDLKTIDQEEVFKNYKELRVECIKDTIIYLSLYTEGETIKILKKLKNFI